jgi:hypothetical protein
MKIKAILLLGMLVFLVGPVSASVGAPPNPPAPAVPLSTNSAMNGAVNNVMGMALSLKEKVHSLLDQAMEQDLDFSEIGDMIEKADALLEKAQMIMRANPVAASNMAREAAEMYEDALSDLEALLG